MPIGTVTRNTERKDLITLPGGYVVVRRMTYGEKLERQDDMLNMRTSIDSSSFELKMMSKSMALKDFGNLIVEHNITDENERLLNFKDAKDVVSLDPRVGEEIGALIDGINTFEETLETKN